MSYGYDSDGNLAKLTYPDGYVIDYTYTARNQLWQVQNGGPPVATYAYDLAGRLTNLDRANGVNTVLTHGTAAGELTAVDHAKGASYVDGVLYSLNAGNGRREGITRSGGWNDAYGYDAAGQVTGASYAANTTGMGSEGFAYDAAGNRTSSVNNGTNVTEYAPNSLDQYSAIGGVSQAHDANGNLTTFLPPVAGALPITLKWDGENRLTEITKTGHKVTNVYDALHRRILKKIHDDDTEVIAKTIAFVYDGWNVIQETEYAGSTTTVVNQKRYTWGADVSGSLQGAGGVGGLLMAEETVLSGTIQTSPIPHYYHYDGNGNVIAITDATGTTEGRYRYTAFGGAANTVTNTTFAATQRYRFSTKYLDKEVETAEGLYYYGYRHYVPVIGRWPSRDPIEEEGGNNLNVFVLNNGLNFVDVLGMSVEDVAGGAFRLWRSGVFTIAGYSTQIAKVKGNEAGLLILAAKMIAAARAACEAEAAKQNPLNCGCCVIDVGYLMSKKSRHLGVEPSGRVIDIFWFNAFYIPKAKNCNGVGAPNSIYDSSRTARRVAKIPM